ncbi:ferritin family protein [Actinomadura monticuli]|uniref:Rubrerythrin diiron-binding domain-containing protein n=1 Tax=Actinomadura monticuli TaxID=3097367 RepID=A0ABV4Q4L5_9ACTN
MESQQDIVAGLSAAFTHESLTVARYLSFAQTAEIEGRAEAAAAFQEIAESVACAVQGHFDLLRDLEDPLTGLPLGGTGINLRAAVTADLQAMIEMYPRLARIAHAAGLADVASWLETLTMLKRSHAARLRRLTEDPVGMASTGEAG